MRVFVRLVALCVVFVAAGPARLLAQTPRTVSTAAGQRFLHSVASVLETAPELSSIRAIRDVELAKTQVERSAGTPWAEIQQEGIGSGFDYEANAQTSVRFATPFNYPWQAGAARDWVESVQSALEAETRAVELEVLKSVATHWLELATLAEKRLLAELRLERFESAVQLQRVRLELGEVAGAEVTQLELQLIRVQSYKAQISAAYDAAEAALLLRCGERCQPPMPGDLEMMVSDSATPTDVVVAAGIDQAPAVVAVKRRAELGLVRAEFAEKTTWGRPEFMVEWEHFPTLEGLPSYDAFGAQLAVPLPFGRAGSQKKAEAQAEARLAESHRLLRRLQIGRELQAALATARGQEIRLASLGQALSRLPVIEHSLAEQFNLGALSYLAYIDGLSRLDDVRIQTIEGRGELLAARLEIAILLDDPSCIPLPSSLGREVQP